MQNPVVAALTAAVRVRPSAPLVTWYDVRTSARTELSVRSFANWVDKTANLLGELDAAGGTVFGELSTTRPGHWMSLVWPLAVWQAGATYSLDPAVDAAVAVVGPDDPRPRVAGVTIACSLHPLALGLGGLTGGVLDFTTEALAQPDAHLAADVAVDALAWIDRTDRRTHATLTAPDRLGRALVLPSDAWTTLADAVIGPLTGGGSAVVVEGYPDDATLARLAASERVTTSMA